VPVPSKSAAVTSVSALIPVLLNAPAKVAYARRTLMLP
jgi:hypothetical protein